MARNTIKIDADRFKREIYRKNRNLQSMSEELGYSRSYLAQACKNGTLTESVVKMLDQVYGIPQERYELKDGMPTEEAAEKSGIDEKALYELIKNAVYEGMKKAWAEI